MQPYVIRMVVEDLTTPNKTQTDYHFPTWEVIESAIRSLNGTTKSLVLLEHSTDSTELMAIGGGDDGLYRCFMSDAEGIAHVLVDPSKPTDVDIKLMMGQPTMVPLHECNDLEAVLTVANRYVAEGILDPGFSWVTQL